MSEIIHECVDVTMTVVISAEHVNYSMNPCLVFVHVSYACAYE